MWVNGSLASKSKSNAYLYAYFVLQNFFVVPLPPPLSFPQAGPVHSLFQQDLAAEILVQTGNSVDYSLAIRLLSLQWLNLLHHEIAWLSARLESMLCSNPLFTPLTTDPATRLPSQANPSLSLTPLKKRKEKKFIWIPSGHWVRIAVRQVD